MTSRRLLEPEARVLLDAADYIEKHGHYKGNFADWHYPIETAPRCAVGAISWACKGNALAASSAVNSLCSFLGTEHVVQWNDKPERVADEVIAALRGAALMPIPSALRQEA